MLSTRWQTSPRRHGIVHERGVAIPVRAGFTLDGDVLRPDDPGRFPVILCMFPFDKALQLAPHRPRAIAPELVAAEGGDFNFYVRRGYAQVFVNLRGTGASGGVFDHLGKGTIEDLYDAIEWLARQPWCDGQVATFGTSYFAMTAKRVAMLKPPALKTLFAPFGVTDEYRQAVFQGGIFSFRFHTHWLKSLSNLRVRQDFPERIGRAEFERRVQAALEDPELRIQPELVEVLRHPHDGGNMHIVEYLLNFLDNEHFAEKAISFRQDLTIPAYFGGCWGMHPLHLPGDFLSYQRWSGPKKLTIGPPYYLDRPVYQYANESLRWFDYWLKGIDTQIMEEAPIQLFIRNTGEWKPAHEWPLPETRWTEFYLHQDGLMYEHEFFPDDDRSSFIESPTQHGALEFRTPPVVENTEIVGPLVLNFWASTTDTEVLWFVTLFQQDASGTETILTRGWLRGSQRRVDAAQSTSWAPHHPHDRREPLTPGEIYEFNIAIVPTGVLLTGGMRLGLRIKATDRDAVPTDFIDLHAYGHLWRDTEQHITVYHDSAHPSHLLVPVTRGNRLGLFASGGVMPPLAPH
ncbi:MAG TPA: CocE/NonD family hydrolase [Steroidobacteraceae bacterium]|nr:CocE/NonD family hydrolase [Steroidobacteraceae bacterium]